MPRVPRAAPAALAACLLAFASHASAKVRIDVDLDMQTMHVEGKDRSFDTKVSSGKPGHETPAGDFKVLWMDKDHHSDEYDGAFMPNAIFFAPGFAIHGFGKSPWGHKASHGCIRIPVAKSAELFDMVKAEGGAEISVRGVTDGVAPTVAEAEAKARARTEATDYAPGDGRYGAPRGRPYPDEAYYPPRRYANPYDGYGYAAPYDAY